MAIKVYLYEQNMERARRMNRLTQGKFCFYSMMIYFVLQ